MTVRDPSKAWKEMEDIREVPRLMWEGTRALHEEPRKWLPPEPDEGQEAGDGDSVSEYDQRISQTIVHPFYSRAVSRSISAMFTKPISPKEDVSPKMREWFEDIDLEGNDLNAFLSYVAEDSIGDAGFSCVMVTHDPIFGPDGEQITEPTVAQVEQADLRPYWVHVKARNVLDAKPHYVGSRKELGYLRILEEKENLDDTVTPRVREIFAARSEDEYVSWVLYEEPPEESQDKEWVVVDVGTMAPFKQIPLAVYYTGKKGWFRAIPPFEDLAWLNLQHTREWSGQGESIRISGGAQLHRSGISIDDAKKQRAIGTKRLLVSEPPEAKAEWLERSGEAATVSMKREDRLRDDMIRLSNEVHVRRTGVETATGKIIDTTQAKTEVQRWAMALRDFTEQLMSFTAVYEGKETGGQVSVPEPFRWSERSIEALNMLLDMHERTGFPTLEILALEVQAQGWVSDDLDIRVVVKQVEEMMETRRKETQEAQQVSESPREPDDGSEADVSE